MSDEQGRQNWWGTLSGVLTASAAGVTAVGGLVGLLYQTGVFHTPAPAATPIAASAPAAQDTTPAIAGNIASNMPYFTGAWQNINPKAGELLKIQVRIADAKMYVHAWIKCHPTDCDWGEVQAQGFGGNAGSGPGGGVREVVAQFKTEVHQTTLTIHPAPNNRIRVESATNFVDRSGRAPFARVFVFERG